ncbi:MAG: FAD-dependent oxidoreductase [Deltaproteobacteria bacterium]|jgi:heterodisulfide reductase subunit A|nr:FAD-dependent oxidoreductase [Deltaproteobacteria bacterium]
METKTGSALVIGAGISGIRSALDLAEMNYRVFLIDKSPHIGGILSQLDYQFPTDHCGMCKMLPTIGRDASSQFCLRKGLFHENIEVLPGTEMTALEGEPGNFRVTLDSAPSFIDAQKCIGCGRCSAVCPVEVPDQFNGGLTKRKAVYLPVPHNIPNRFMIDIAACTRCAECEKVCPTGAIDLRTEARRAFRILVVDDELVVRDSLKEWLVVEGFSVDMAASGAEAIDLFSSNDYGLVLLDVKMPGMDGVEALQIIREIKPDLPVLMMTAYATVETAVQAMKIGADDYLMKPFDIEALVAKVVQQYERTVTVKGRVIEVGAVIMAAGSDFCDPARTPGAFGYNLPNVVTGLQFERLLSGAGPGAGKLIRPSDGRPLRKIAFLQCIGSRDLKQKADYCSSVCCMFSIKEALLAKAKSGGEADAAIFYMDMRTFGKDFQRYRDLAEKESGVRFIRSRVHTIDPDADGSLRLHYVDGEGGQHEEVFDMVVLAAGQRPNRGTRDLAQSAGIELNPAGFCLTDELFQNRSSREGVFAGGSFAGLRDISESVIQAGSASLGASKLIRSKGGAPRASERTGAALQDVSKELPSLAVALCACASSLRGGLDLESFGKSLTLWDPSIRVFQIERVCTLSGRKSLLENMRESGCNMISIGACMPCLYGKMLVELAKETGLSAGLMDVVDIYTPAFRGDRTDPRQISGRIESALKMSIGRLKSADPGPTRSLSIIRKALVIGGGISGMTAALAIADHGFHVDMIEKDVDPGGLVRSLYRTIEGTETSGLIEKLISDVRANTNISVHTEAEVVDSKPYEGLSFLTTIKTKDGGEKRLDHGVTILATGGKEATTREYCYGMSESVITLHELEAHLGKSAGAAEPPGSVAMIQCVGSREEGRNYCSRVCCSSALKNALRLKKENPKADLFIFYRDIMTYGFLEAYYTKARQEGIIFIRYSPEAKPDVSIADGGKVRISARDPILGRDIVLEPDLLVLSTGVVPNDLNGLGQVFGFEVNEDGFFREAEYKWQPVNSKKRGIFACGLAHSPRSISEAIAMAQAAAQRALVMLNREEIEAGAVVARVRRSLCSLCERCIAACPYGARSRSEEKDIIEIDELACQGCGACAAVCPNSASVVRGFSDRQVMAMVDAALELT